jgi:hypothetical protein
MEQALQRAKAGHKLDLSQPAGSGATNHIGYYHPFKVVTQIFQIWILLVLHIDPATDKK